MSVLHQRWEELITDQYLIKHIRRLPEIGWEQKDDFKEKLRQDHLKYLKNSDINNNNIFPILLYFTIQV